MVMPLWLGSSLRPEHAISELMAQPVVGPVSSNAQVFQLESARIIAPVMPNSA
jgi:hypothetical protein